MSRTRYVAHCSTCDANIRLTELGKKCPACKKPLSDGRVFRTPDVGGELIGAWGSPFPEIKDGPNRGMNVAPSLKALKAAGRRQGITWQ